MYRAVCVRQRTQMNVTRALVPPTVDVDTRDVIVTAGLVTSHFNTEDIAGTSEFCCVHCVT